jgi:hypothetical protein
MRARLLLEAGADINAKESFGGLVGADVGRGAESAGDVKFLHQRALTSMRAAVIRQWERKVITEPRPKDMNKGGFTPLLYAAREGCVECARHLIVGRRRSDLEDPTASRRSTWRC